MAPCTARRRHVLTSVLPSMHLVAAAGVLLLCALPTARAQLSTPHVKAMQADLLANNKFLRRNATEDTTPPKPRYRIPVTANLSSCQTRHQLLCTKNITLKTYIAE